MYNTYTRKCIVIICLCNQISDKQLEELLDQNPSLKASDVAKKLGLGSDCGSCLQDFIQHSRKHPYSHSKGEQTKIRTLVPKK